MEIWKPSIVALALLFATALAEDPMESENEEVTFGVCPIPTGKLGTCAMTCLENSQCQSDESSQDLRMCCSNGCGTQCMDPALQVSELTACTATRQMLLTVMEQAGYTPLQDLSIPLGFYIPTCNLDDGLFASVQCMGSSICWCVDPFTGEELAGSRTLDGPPDCEFHDPSKCPPLPKNCTEICKYGYALDENACQICSCYEPCLNFTCPDKEEICKPFHVFCTSPPCSALPECVAQGHPSCPPFSDNGDCDILCDDDTSCSSDQHCCGTGCGKKCLTTTTTDAPQTPDACPDPAKIEGACASHCKVEEEGGCGEDELCCLNSCGHSQCVNPNVINDKQAQSDCLEQQSDALRSHTTMENNLPYIPRCVESGLWEGVQCSEALGLCWCVNSTSGIRTTDYVRGTPNCNIEIDEHPLNESISVCDSGAKPTECSSLYLCSMSVCLQHPTAVCRLDPCGNCTPRFYNASNMEVNCSKPALTECQERRQSILNKSSRPLDVSDFIISFKDDEDQLSQYIGKDSEEVIKRLGGVCGIPPIAADIDPKNFDSELIKLMSSLGVGQYSMPNADLSDLLDMYGAQSNLTLLQMFELLELLGAADDGELFSSAFAGTFETLLGSLFSGLQRRRRDSLSDWLAAQGEDLSDLINQGQEFLEDLDLDLDAFFGDGVPNLDSLLQGFQLFITEMAKTKPLFLQYVPTCTAEGAYDWMQCHGNSGVCWCVNESGNPLPDTITTMSSTNFLQCNSGGRVNGTGGGDPDELFFLCGLKADGKSPADLLCLDTQCYRDDCPGSPESFCVIDPCLGCEPFYWQECHRLGQESNCEPTIPAPVPMPAPSAPTKASTTSCPVIPDCNACSDQTKPDCPASPCALCISDSSCGCKATFSDYQNEPIDCDGDRLGPCFEMSNCLEDSGGGSFMPNCTATGQFASLQCNIEATPSQCWCTNTNGEEIADTRKEGVNTTTYPISCGTLDVTSFKLSISFKKDFSKVKGDKDKNNFIEAFVTHLLETYEGMVKEMVHDIEVSEGSIMVNFTLMDYAPTDEKKKEVETYFHHIEASVKKGTFTFPFNGEEFSADPDSMSSSSDTSELPSSGSGLSTGAVVAVVVVVLVVVLVIAGIGFVYYQRHSSQGGPGAKYTRDLGKDGEQVAFSNEYHDYPTANA